MPRTSRPDLMRRRSVQLALTDHRIRLIQPLPLDSEEGIAGRLTYRTQRAKCESGYADAVDACWL
jgi:hypothetical protein